MQITNTQPDPKGIFLGKVLYFLIFMAYAALLPFLSVYYEESGLSGWQIGILNSIPPLTSMVAAPIWGGLADATQKRKLLVNIGLVGSMGVMAVFAFTVDFYVLIPLVILNAFFLAVVMPLLDTSVVDLLGEQKERYGRVRLWGAGGWGASAPLIGIIVERYELRWAFFLYIIFLGIYTLVVQKLPVTGAEEKVRVWQETLALMRNVRWLICP